MTQTRRTVTVVWISPKGAGRMRVFDDADKLWAFLDKLRCPATVRNAHGEKIGAVERHDGDDARRKWFAWFERDEVGDYTRPASNTNSAGEHK